ncbi:hypothetical protein MPER_14599, partial [Moniliophthora perniciosa FA553]
CTQPTICCPHPLVSPALSYLGGLPPLFFIASDKEVLRDEIIYTAHKAAYPDKYPVKDEVRAIYPKLNGIEQRYGATPVHHQVYGSCSSRAFLVHHAGKVLLPSDSFVL